MRFLSKLLRSDKENESASNKNPIHVDKKSESTYIVKLLDDNDFTAFLKPSCKGEELFNRVIEHLQLVDVDYFGLRFVDQSKQTHWLDQNHSLYSQLKTLGPPPYVLYFGVKFYSDNPCKLRDENTRFQIFLQVKNDIAQGRLVVSNGRAAQLSAYALQSEIGDYDPSRLSQGYVSEFRFIPNQTPDFEEHVAVLHRKLVGTTPVIAEYQFLQDVKWLDMYGVDMHPVLGEGQLEYFLGLTPTGIVVYKNKVKVGEYFWTRILKVTVKNKLFILKVKDKNNEVQSYIFETTTKPACRHLWKCCIEQLNFFRHSRGVENIHTRFGLFKWTSKVRFSFRKDPIYLKSNRQYPTQVYNKQSRRRNQKLPSLDDDVYSSMESVYKNQNEESLTISIEPSHPYRNQSFPILPNHSPESVRSMPWESNLDGGLYTSGRDSPDSLHSEKMKFPPRRAMTASSDTELATRKKYLKKIDDSDNESHVSLPRIRRRETDTSGSDSESGPRHVMREKRRHHHHERHRGVDIVRLENGDVSPVTRARIEASKIRRQRRARSRSPSHRPPEELKHHFEYDLIDTDGMSLDQLQDIPFVSVQTKAEPFRLYYDKGRRRYRSPRRTAEGDLKGKGITVDNIASSKGSPSNSNVSPETHHVIITDPVSSKDVLEQRADYNRNTDDYQNGVRQEVQVKMGSMYKSKDDDTRKDPYLDQSLYISTQKEINGHQNRQQTSTITETSFNTTTINPTCTNTTKDTVSTTRRDNSILSSSSKLPPSGSSSLLYDYKSSREAYRNAMWKRYSQGVSDTSKLESDVSFNQGPSDGNKSSRPDHKTASMFSETIEYRQRAPYAIEHVSFSSLTSQQCSKPPAPFTMKRPVYSWSHFQPVRLTPSPATQSGAAHHNRRERCTDL